MTNDLARRISEHKAKLVPGFTRQYGVDLLVYFETYDSILEARSPGARLKRWRRAWKIALIEKLNPDWQDLSDQLKFVMQSHKPRISSAPRSRAALHPGHEMAPATDIIHNSVALSGLVTWPHLG